MSGTTKETLRAKLQGWLQRETELDGMLSTMLETGEISAEQHFDLRGGTRLMIDVLRYSLEKNADGAASEWGTQTL